MVTFHTGEPTPDLRPEPLGQLVREWLLPTRYRHRLARDLGLESKVQPHQALAVLARTDYDREQLKSLVAEDLQRQLLQQGLFGVNLIEESDLGVDPTVTARYHIYRLGLRKLILPGPLTLNLGAVRTRVEGYEAVAKLEFCYFRRILDPFYRRYLITSYPGNMGSSLRELLLTIPQTDAQSRWRDSLFSCVRALLAEYCPEPLHVLHREEEKLFLRDLAIRTFSEHGFHESYLRYALKQRYTR